MTVGDVHAKESRKYAGASCTVGGTTVIVFTCGPGAIRAEKTLGNVSGSNCADKRATTSMKRTVCNKSVHIDAMAM